MARLLKTVSLFSIFSASLALQVAPGSKCASLCLDNPDGNANDPNSSNTNTTDITCSDGDYQTTGIGAKYKNCLDCLMTSDSVDTSTSENDVAWFLYNLRYAVDVCLYGFGNSEKVSSPCDIDTSCQPLQGALMDGDLDPDNLSAYSYCDADNGSFADSSIQACVSCLQADSSQKYLANFLIALEAGCEQKPAAGTILGLQGDLFSSAGVNITTPVVTSAQDGNTGTGMTVGTIVGIAVGAALLFLGGTGLFVVYYRRNKKHNSSMTPPGAVPPRSAVGSFQSYPPEHKKSGSFHSELEMNHGRQGNNGQPRFGSANADYYDKLEEVMEMGLPTPGGKNKFTYDPHADALNSKSALPAHPAYIPRAMSRSNTPSPIPPPPTAASKSSPRHPAPPVAHSKLSPKRAPPAPITTYTPPTSPPTQLDVRSSITSGIGSKRANRPPPLQNISHQKSGSSSSWSLQKYLSNSEDTPIPIPPPPPMTGRSVLSQQSHASNRSNFSTGAAHGTMTSQGPGTSGQTISPPLPPPPPGPPPPQGASASNSSSKEGKTTPSRRIPHLSIPSVPRIKVPKKYPPPHITVEGATPIEANDISGPMDPRTMASVPRFHDNSFGDNHNGQVIERQIPVPSWRRFEAEEVQTGKSARLYG